MKEKITVDAESFSSFRLHPSSFLSDAPETDLDRKDQKRSFASAY
jgi:hypothetical protein